MTLSRVLTAGALVAAAAGPVRADVELWTEAGVRWEPDDRLQLSYDQHLRFDRDVSRVSAVMEEPQVHYRPVRWFRTGVGYRAQYERDGDGFLVWRHRFQYDMRFRVDVGDFRLDYEPQFEYEYRGSANNDKHRHRIRNDFGAAYRRWKWVVPKASAELFHPLWDAGETIHYEKVRLTFGVELEYEQHSLDAYYRFEVFDLPGATLRHIIGVGYHYELELGKAKKPKKPKKPKDGEEPAVEEPALKRATGDGRPATVDR